MGCRARLLAFEDLLIQFQELMEGLLAPYFVK